MTASAPSQWICDTCGNLIQKPEDGYVELLVDSNDRVTGATIVHRHFVSPGCPTGTGRDYELSNLIGPDGLNLLLGFIAPNEHGGHQVLQEIHPNYIAGWVTLIRRLHIPHYDQTRDVVARAISRSGGEVNGDDPYLYTQRSMESYRKDYDDRE